MSIGAVARRRGLDVLIGTVVILIVASPLLFTRNGFETDFTNNLWLVWSQGASISSGRVPLPTYFFNTTTQGIFNPVFAFYGGTFFAISGALSAVLGGRAVVAFVAIMLAGLTSAYCGMLWLARQCGLRGPVAHAPAIVVLTSAFNVTELYGRADTPEFVALSAIPAVVAGGVHLARTPRWTAMPVLVFVAAVVFFTGSHNITLAWGVLIGVVVGGVLLALVRPVALPAIRRLVALAALGVLAVAINGYYLLPEVFYIGRVAAAHTQSGIDLAATSFFDTPEVLFNPLRHVPAASTTPALYVQAPVWFVLWAMVAGGVLFRRRRGADARLWRVWLAVATVLVAVILLVMSSWPWEHMPAPFVYIQFPYRLDGFVALLSGGLVLVGALAVRESPTGRSSRLLRLGLAVVVCISLGLCVWQLWVPNVRGPGAYPDRREALISVNVLPRTWYDPDSFTDNSQPIVAVPAGRQLTIEPGLVRGDAVSALENVPPGSAPIATNIATGPYFVKISGLRALGRTAGGFEVVAREPRDALSGAPAVLPIRISVADSALMLLGRWLSIVGLLGCLVVIVYVSRRQLRAGR